MSSRKKILVAFDFDHTVIDGNSDIEISHLCPGGKVPKEIKSKYSEKSWTNYMGAIFKYLHEHGTTAADMENTIHSIPLTAGMEELFKFLNQEPFEVIIISDSNSVFIDYSLKFHNYQFVKSVYTNPAAFDDDGLLKIEYYHTQDWCDLSTENLCKGHILNDHIKQSTYDYQNVLYVGDGGNDLCPGLRLKHSDYLFPRKNYSLWKKLGVLGCLDGVTTEVDMKAKIVEWTSGTEILEVCKQLYREGQSDTVTS